MTNEQEQQWREEFKSFYSPDVYVHYERHKPSVLERDWALFRNGKQSSQSIIDGLRELNNKLNKDHEAYAMKCAAQAKEIEELKRKLELSFSPDDVKELQDLSRQTALEEAKRQAVPEGMVLIREDIRDFLLGASPFGDLWFGEEDTTHKGRYWWRQYLTPDNAMLSASPKPEGVDK